MYKGLYSLVLNMDQGYSELNTMCIERLDGSLMLRVVLATGQLREVFLVTLIDKEMV